MKFIISILDKYLCKYLGIKVQETIPQVIRHDNNDVAVLSADPHKRHIQKQDWQVFSETTLKHLSTDSKQKVGISLGKAIAKNLIISFDQTKNLKVLNND